MPWIRLLAVLLALAACGRGEAPLKPQVPAAAEKKPPVVSDPREAFESSGRISDTAMQIDGLAPFGGGGRLVPRAGPVPIEDLIVVAYGGGQGAELLAAYDAAGQIRFSVSLPAPALALVAVGDSAIVSCADGSLRAIGFPPDGSPPAELWRSSGPPSHRLLALPGGRIASASEDGRLSAISGSSGAELWGTRLPGAASSIAYAPGIVIAAVGLELHAYTESEGSLAWKDQLPALAVSASAGGGVAGVVDERGRAAFFALDDGHKLSENPGPFDPDLCPVLGTDFAALAMRSGGGAKLATKTGALIGTWKWRAEASFLATAGSSLLVGAGSRLIVQGLDAFEEEPGVALASRAFGRPAAGRPGLVLLCVDGSMARAGPAPRPASAIEPALTPEPAVVDSICATLARYRARGDTPLADYLRFDLVVNGVPVASRPRFTAFRFQSEKGARLAVNLEPDPGDAIITVFDEAGRELESNTDELGAPARLARFYEQGKRYWIAVGRRGSAEDQTGAGSEDDAPAFAFYLR